MSKLQRPQTGRFPRRFHRTGMAGVVAQLLNLLYRRFSIGRASANDRPPALRSTPAECKSAVRRIENLRCGLPKWTALLVFLLLSPANDIAAAEGESGPGFRAIPVTVPSGKQPGFTALPPTVTGILFTNVMPERRHLTNQIFLNGSGVAAGDVDGDGWCDLYFCSLDGPNALYRNLGNWKFQDITKAAGVACPDLDATGAALADLDGDGDLDLIVNSVGGGTHVFLNDGKGHFRKMAQLNGRKGGTSLALADLDGDGFLDLYIANYRTTALMDIPNARATFKIVGGRTVVDRLNGRPVTDPDLADRFIVDERGHVVEQGEVDALYLNQNETNFVPISFTSGAFLDEDGKPLATPPFDWGLTVQIRDINGDGLPDIYVCNDFESPDRCWLNRGGGRFQAWPRLAQRKSSVSCMSVDFADINRDGFDDFLTLDMLSRDHRQRMTQKTELPLPGAVIGQFETRPQCGLNTLFLNRGDGTYAEIAQLTGLEAAEWAWALAFLDVDLDGWEDALICNGQMRAALDFDVTEQLRKMRAAKPMSDAEIFQARKMFPRLETANLIFRNRGDLTFEEMGGRWGFDSRLHSSSLALADLDNDGDLDVIVNNLNDAPGVYRNDSGAPRLAVRLKGQPPNTRGVGGRIKVFGGAVPMQSQEMVCGGRYLASDDPMRVFAAGSLTNDLRIEVTWRGGKRSVVNHARPNHLYEIDEAGAPTPTDLPSASPILTAGDEVTSLTSPKSQRLLTRLPIGGQASSATGSTWNGVRMGIPDLPASKPSAANSPNAPPSPVFQDVSDRLGHTHYEEPFDDFARQPLLPNRLSQLGPGVSWFDVDGDGWDDLIIGSGKGGRLAVYRNDGRGGFKRIEEAPLTLPVIRDQTTVLGWRQAGQTRLLVGSANYEDGLTAGSCVRQLDLVKKTADDSLRASLSSTGPLALADVDGDGDLDLVVGGRCVPGKYPRAASSTLFRWADGKFVVDLENSRRLADVGLVNGAVFSDLDGDGDPDLILACDWGPIRVFRNDAGILTPWDWPVILPPDFSITHHHLPRTTCQSPIANYELPIANPRPSSLSRLPGWWNGVTVGDFDGDGQLDIIASNWGRNTKYECHRQRPLRLFYGDLDGNGTEDVVEAYFDVAMNKVVPERQFGPMAQAMPFLRERFSTHKTYAEAGVEEIFGGRLANARSWEANWLESTVFLNRGQRFEVRVLPIEAQMAPAFGVGVGDYDGDGHEDIFLSQNFFATQPETPRYDGGRGLWLRGDGRGEFRAASGQESGVKVYGEQRGCALADYDGDGRVDLAVAQNGAATKLFHNVGAKAGLRIRLQGPPNNPTAIGACLRLVFGQRMGPAREIHAGSGYGSQDGAVQVMGIPEQPTQVWVRWPGGKATTVPIPADAPELRVNAPP